MKLVSLLNGRVKHARETHVKITPTPVCSTQLAPLLASISVTSRVNVLPMGGSFRARINDKVVWTHQVDGGEKSGVVSSGCETLPDPTARAMPGPRMQFLQPELH